MLSQLEDSKKEALESQIMNDSYDFSNNEKMPPGTPQIFSEISQSRIIQDIYDSCPISGITHVQLYIESATPSKLRVSGYESPILVAVEFFSIMKHQT
jgi:hypothetical protein